MRRPWPKDYLLDDILIEHLYPGQEYCPVGGFGDLRLLETEESRLTVYAMTGLTVEQHDDEDDMAEDLCIRIEE